MRLVASVLLFTALLVTATSVVAQSPATPFALSISSDKPEVPSTSDVFIKITLTNTSNHDVSCTSVYKDGLNKSYTYEVYDSEGKRVPNIRRKHPELESGGNAELCTLKPGESVTQSSRISQLVDLQQPGKYVVQVSRRNAESETSGPVLSNKIALVIKN